MPSLIFWLSSTSVVIMIPAILFQLLVGWNWGSNLGVGPQSVRAQSEFNNPPGVDIWCGKAYRETNSSFDPGGWLNPPGPIDKQLRLDLRIYPRYSIYLAGDTKGEFVIDTPVQYVAGTAYKNETFDSESSNPSKKIPFTWLKVRISNVQTNGLLVPWTRVPINTTGNIVEFDLRDINADRDNPWTISAIGASPDGIQTYYSGTALTVLPERNDTGSVARIDNLYGGIQVKSALTESVWKPIFPYSFYTSWDWISSTLTNSSATKTLRDFRRNGYNLIHPVPPGGSDPFDPSIFEKFLQLCDELELYVMYDMRHTYQNTTSVSTQLSRLQNHPSLLLYYTADEPDGQGDPLNATSLSYKHIKSIDPYHPVSLVLNCANFYFKEYTSGADIILEDVYPIAVDTAFSTVYNTVCNTTYGDCGCDNCHANDKAYPPYVKNPFLDITERTENMYTYQTWIGTSAKKPVWGVPQAFYDRGSFWGRFPTAKEQAVMGLLRIVHGSKGIVAWIYPTSEELEKATSALAQVVAGDEVASFLLGTKREKLEVTGGGGLVDAAIWIKDKEAVIIYVHQSYNTSGSLTLTIPKAAGSGDVEVLYGPGSWVVATTNGSRSIEKSSTEGLEVGILKVVHE